MYLNEVMGDVYKQWNGGDSVFISAPTGVGKTTFVLQQLVPEAKSRGKEVLFLSNRTVLRDQIKNIVARQQGIPEDTEFLKDVEEFDGITLASYQKIQAIQEQSCMNPYEDAKRYLYVVFDEAHYILEDSLFNPRIIYLEKFLKDCSMVKVFMSATISEVQDYLLHTQYADKRFGVEKEIISNYVSRELLKTYGFYSGSYSYLWYVNYPEQRRNVTVKYFDNFEQIATRINNSDEKWLIFIGNKNKAGDWANGIERACEIISAEYKESEVVADIICNEKFETDVLITTKLLDNGVNFKDSQLKNIVLDTISETEFIQMLGRKRLKENEKITLYIPKKNKMFFVGYGNLHFLKIKKILGSNLRRRTLVQEVLDSPEMYEIMRRFFLCLPKKEWYEQEEKERLIINKAGKHKVDILYAFVKNMESAMEEDEYAFVKEQLSWIGEEDSFSLDNDLIFNDRRKVVNDLSMYLDSLQNMEMNKEQQELFRKKMTSYMRLLGRELKSGRIVGKRIISKFLDECEIPYAIEVQKATKKGTVSKWSVRRKVYGVAS